MKLPGSLVACLPAVMSLFSAQPLQVVAQSNSQKIVVISHRGEHLHHPENTLPAYQAAIDAGADFFEVDVRTTSDGQFVLMHDSDVHRTTNGSGKVRELTFQQIRSLDAGAKFAPEFQGVKVPTLDEALSLAEGKTGIYLDVKGADPEQLVNTVVQHHMEHHVLVYGNPELLATVERLRPDMKVMPEADSEASCKMLLEHLHPKVLAFEESDFRPSVIQLAKEAHADIYVDRLWIRDRAEDWAAAIAQGATGIQTDHPAELVQFLTQRSKH